MLQRSLFKCGNVIMFFGCAALQPVECTFSTMGIS